MHPILLDFGLVDLPLLGPTHLFLPTYGLFFAGGALLAWWWFVRRARTLGIPAESAFNLAFYTLLAGLVGAKLTLVAVDWRYYLANPGQVLGILRSAGVLMGGVLAGMVVFILYARRQRLPLPAVGDAIAAPLALAQGIGRLGCFCAGCCWGVASNAWCAVQFRDPAANAQTGVPLGVSLLPIQVVEAAFDFVLTLLLTWLWRRGPRPDGAVFAAYLIAYGLGRTVLELWRGDPVRGLWFGGSVSTSQLFSAAAVLFAVAYLLSRRMRKAFGAAA